MATFSLCPHTAFLLCTNRHRDRVRERSGVSSSSYKDTNTIIRLGPHPHDLHLTLITSLRALSPNIVTLRVRTSSMNLGGRGRYDSVYDT